MRDRNGAEEPKDKRQIVSKEKQWEMDSGQHERKRQKKSTKKRKDKLKTKKKTRSNRYKRCFKSKAIESYVL